MSAVEIPVGTWHFTPAAELWLPRLEKPTRRILEGFLLGDFVRMAGSMSNYLSKKVLEEAFGGVAFGAPTDDYLGLWTAALDDTSTGAAANEANYGSYARTKIGTSNNQTDAWNAATGTTTATVTNKNAITCPTSTSGSNTITYVGVLDALTVGTGNMLVWADVTSTVIASGDTPKVNASALSIVQN